MKRVLVTIVLALSTGAMVQVNAQQPPAQQPPAQQTPGADQANIPTSQKVIKDQAEYNAYITALNTQDPAAKAQAMENFVTQYPNSIVKIDALEQAMAAYQQAGNQAKVEETAKRILQMNPNNVRALAIVTFIGRGQASMGKTQDLAATCSGAEKGIQEIPRWPKPEGTTDADYQKLKTSMTGIFEGTAGFCALQNKNYAAARDHYMKSIQIDPNNMTDIYQLGVADLEMNPIDKNGFWYIAKAYNLAPSPQAKQAIMNYGKAKYHKFHGGDDGWDQIVAEAATQTAPGPDIAAIKPAPTPPELAVKAVQDNPPDTLSFADWEFILQYRDVSPANKDAADKVWEAIQNKQKDSKGQPAKLKLNVKVISATPDAIEAAITEDNQQANKADLHVVLAKPLAKPPAAGSMTDVIGTISSYTPSPFMFTMTDGEVPGAKPPAKKPTPHHRPTRTHKR